MNSQKVKVKKKMQSLDIGSIEGMEDNFSLIK